MANFRSYTESLRASSSRILKVSKDGDSATSLGILFIMIFFFLQYAVKISLLLHVVAFTACPFTMQTTRLWITCPYPMFLVKKEKKKKPKKTERTALIFHQFRNCMTCRRAFIHRREESLLRVCTV